ncbi:Ig-like domain-containing protein [Yersinia enterocolitica]|uniref:Ig-like domain-containing protein n=1 Tax=Yersinia enterocolitica TaxID=630 RepID=UPI0029AB3524|nr:Ig-like domain-containing protein [Yersinia enterocolitica]
MNNITPFNTPILSHSIVSDNQLPNSGIPNVVVFSLQINNVPMAGQSITVSLPSQLSYITTLTTDVNGQCYSSITSASSGGFSGTAFFTTNPAVSTTFTTTFGQAFPVTIRDRIMYFDSKYHTVTQCLSGLQLRMNHHYRVTLSRLFTVHLCSNDTRYVAIKTLQASDAICSLNYPLSFDDLSGDGLYFRSFYDGDGGMMYGRFRYRFTLPGNTQVRVEDFGPSPEIVLNSFDYILPAAVSLENNIVDPVEEYCPSCGI